MQVGYTSLSGQPQSAQGTTVWGVPPGGRVLVTDPRAQEALETSRDDTTGQPLWVSDAGPPDLDLDTILNAERGGPLDLG